jgi:hypothetical protein
MIDDKRFALISELAAWNGRFSATIEIALISFKHNNASAGIEALEQVHAEYEAYRNAEYSKLTEQPYKRKRVETDYDEKHGT